MGGVRETHTTDSLSVAPTALQGIRWRGALRDAWDLRLIEEMVDQAEQPDSVVALGSAATHLALQELRVRDLYLTHRYVESHMADAEDTEALPVPASSSTTAL